MYTPATAESTSTTCTSVGTLLCIRSSSTVAREPSDVKGQGSAGRIRQVSHLPAPQESGQAQSWPSQQHTRPSSRPRMEPFGGARDGRWPPGIGWRRSALTQSGRGLTRNRMRLVRGREWPGWMWCGCSAPLKDLRDLKRPCSDSKRIQDQGGLGMQLHAWMHRRQLDADRCSASYNLGG